MVIPDTMTATVLVAPHRFELQQRPVPVPGGEDVLVRVRACGILRLGSENHPRGHAEDAALRQGAAGGLLPRPRHRRRRPGGAAQHHDLHRAGRGWHQRRPRPGLLAAGRLTTKPLITHRFPLARVHEAIDVLERRTGDPVKVILNP